MVRRASGHLHKDPSRHPKNDIYWIPSVALEFFFSVTYGQAMQSARTRRQSLRGRPVGCAYWPSPASCNEGQAVWKCGRAAACVAISSPRFADRASIATPCEAGPGVDPRQFRVRELSGAPIISAPQLRARPREACSMPAPTDHDACTGPAEIKTMRRGLAPPHS